jgi:hypothetical protein
MEDRMCRTLRAAAIGLSLVLTWPAISRAQPAATSLGELRSLGPQISNVTVTDNQGRQFRGTLVDVSDTRLTLRVAGDIRWFGATDVASVRVRKDDPLLNGALIGAATGAGLTSLYFLDNECHRDPACYQAVAVYGAIGAVAGLGLDALIHRQVVVYAARPRAARHDYGVMPVLGRGRTGVRVTIGF